MKATLGGLSSITVLLAGLAAGRGGSPPEPPPAAETATYLGQEPPGEAPEPFAPGIVNTDAIELNGVVSPDGREFFFTRVIDGVFVMHRRLLGDDGRWSDPETVHTYPDRALALAVDMAYSPDGSRLYFLGRFSEELGAEETGRAARTATSGARSDSPAAASPSRSTWARRSTASTVRATPGSRPTRAGWS